jgi:hypothetical protein
MPCHRSFDCSWISYFFEGSICKLVGFFFTNHAKGVGLKRICSSNCIYSRRIRRKNRRPHPIVFQSCDFFPFCYVDYCLLLDHSVPFPPGLSSVACRSRRRSSAIDHGAVYLQMIHFYILWNPLIIYRYFTWFCADIYKLGCILVHESFHGVFVLDSDI